MKVVLISGTFKKNKGVPQNKTPGKETAKGTRRMPTKKGGKMRKKMPGKDSGEGRTWKKPVGSTVKKNTSVENVKK